MESQGTAGPRGSPCGGRGVRAEAGKPGSTSSGTALEVGSAQACCCRRSRGGVETRRAAPVPQRWDRHPLQARGRPGPARPSPRFLRGQAPLARWRLGRLGRRVEGGLEPRQALGSRWSAHARPTVCFPYFLSFLFLKTALLRYNLHTTELTFVKRTVSGFSSFHR